ncbi:hypothetical protein Vadar_024608 [Vaccinium darrowii]|uniref:Uncharacterized protein n=1 Tax=Vaccinium darrowii TaxID=229202 RepID=A0ACB7XT28_9ERIC|nr:hypothetical protein Vadar_024608 [Vaccinium darrowii]
MERDRLDLFTLFVDNLPEDVGINWFRKFFNQYGVVIDAFIPIKRSKVTNRRFGFVRYNCATSAEVAISKANGFWIEDRKLFVKLAAFEVQGKKTFQKRVDQDSHNISIDVKSYGGVDPLFKNGSYIPEKTCKSAVVTIEKSGLSKKVSFADVVKGKYESSSNFTIIAKEITRGEGDDWLSRSVIAKTPSHRSVESIRENFYLEGVINVQIRSMGGNYFVLTFATVNDMKAMIEDPEVNWLGNFFEEYRQWSPDFAFEASRNVWLDCYEKDNHIQEGISKESFCDEVSKKDEINNREYRVRVQEEPFVPKLQLSKIADQTSDSSDEVEDNEVEASIASLANKCDHPSGIESKVGVEDFNFEAHGNLTNQSTGMTNSHSPSKTTESGLEIVEETQLSDLNKEPLQYQEDADLVVSIKEKEVAGFDQVARDDFGRVLGAKLKACVSIIFY